MTVRYRVLSQNESNLQVPVRKHCNVKTLVHGGFNWENHLAMSTCLIYLETPEAEKNASGPRGEK